MRRRTFILLDPCEKEEKQFDKSNSGFDDYVKLRDCLEAQLDRYERLRSFSRLLILVGVIGLLVLRIRGLRRQGKP